MTMELKAAISDRDSLKKNQHALREEMEKELSLTRAKWVLYGVQILYYSNVLSVLSRPV